MAMILRKTYTLIEAAIGVVCKVRMNERVGEKKRCSPIKSTVNTTNVIARKIKNPQQIVYKQKQVVKIKWTNVGCLMNCMNI